MTDGKCFRAVSDNTPESLAAELARLEEIDRKQMETDLAMIENERTTHVNRDERQRIISQNRERLGEAHGLSDDESERALLNIGLDDHQAALERLEREDTLGFIAFGDSDAWIDKRIGKG